LRVAVVVRHVDDDCFVDDIGEGELVVDLDQRSSSNCVREKISQISSVTVAWIDDVIHYGSIQERSHWAAVRRSVQIKMTQRSSAIIVEYLRGVDMEAVD